MMMPPRRSALLLLLAAFLAGGGLGLIVGRNLDRPGRGAMGSPGPGGHLERLTRELDLTPAQQDSVRLILDRHRPGFDSVWAATRPRYETLRASVRSDIRAQLRPEQQARYDSIIERHGAERRRRGR